MAFQFEAKVICHTCRGSGMLTGPMRRLTGGTYIRDERNCETCDGQGYRFERIELNGTALRALAQALAAAAEGPSADVLMAQDAWADNFGKSGS